MIVLGIETSCDDTSAALVEDGKNVICQITSSQVKVHSKFSGVVPELASREHLGNINWIVDKILKAAKGNRIGAVAVTSGPGLVGSLLIGYVTAEALSFIMGLPLIEVNHLEGHMFSAFLNKAVPKFPFISMVVSGGHTDLILVKGWGRYKILGRTKDDACGEAYDKVAKLLGLGYPGGPVIDRLYYKGNPDMYKLPDTVMPGGLDFSFSGLKTAVLYKLREITNGTENPSTVQKTDLAASFQKAAVNILVKKLILAVNSLNVKTIALGGGVTANSLLRSKLNAASAERGFKVHMPDFSYCVDNAAMIAQVAYFKMKYLAKSKSCYSENTGVNPSSAVSGWF